MYEDNNETIEDVILRYSNRGMKDIRTYISNDCCDKAAKEILSWKKGNVFLATGFYADGYAETDGPAGTAALALALRSLGYAPVIITDKYCKGFFEPENIQTIYIDCKATADIFDGLVAEYKPKGMVSIERCGKNRYGDYTNMRGFSISGYTAPIDELFIRYQGIIPTIGVGDGGNEIGMGKIEGAIRRKLSVEPCMASTDILVIASVSNWGAYGIAAALGRLRKVNLLPDFEWVENYIRKTVEIGSVDGITFEKTISVDGKDMAIEREILSALQRLIYTGVH